VDVRLRELLAANLEDGLNQYVVGCLGNMNAVKAYQEQARSTVWPEMPEGAAPADAPAPAQPPRPQRWSESAPEGDKALDC